MEKYAPFHIFLPMLLPALLCSCAKEIVMDAGDESLVVVECVLTQQPVQTLRLSFTKSVSMSEAPALTEAEAVLIDLTEGKTVGSFERQDEGTWTLGYTPIPEHSYRLEVDVPGQEPIWAEQTMPDTAPFRFTYSFVPYGTGYYTYRQKGYDHIWIWALKYNPETRRREYVERLCTDWPYTDNFNLTGEMYIPQVADTTYYGNPAPSKLYPMLEGTPLHKRFLRLDLTKASHSNKGLIISGDFEGKFFHYPPYGHVYNIFSNIHGGLGIFGAYTTSIHMWTYGYAPEGYDRNQP